MLNKDFLRDILADKKKLMKLADVTPIVVPKYDELSVKALLPQWQVQPDFWIYFPDQLAQHRLPDRVYFFTIMNSLQPAYTSAMIKHAQKLRFTGKHDQDEGESIVVSKHWAESLQALPFISCKNSNLPHLYREARQYGASAQSQQQARRHQLQAQETLGACRQLASITGRARGNQGRAHGERRDGRHDARLFVARPSEAQPSQAALDVT